jgi:hypothetical protein
MLTDKTSMRLHREKKGKRCVALWARAFERGQSLHVVASAQRAHVRLVAQRAACTRVLITGAESREIDNLLHDLLIIVTSFQADELSSS